ncbi:hypothetical protein, partial [Allobaculum fili]|uniref:hypothetical protein n=1 Tax=Allobaculum fili TaxID=2834460 RepID=UPI001E5118BF
AQPAAHWAVGRAVFYKEERRRLHGNCEGVCARFLDGFYLTLTAFSKIIMHISSTKPNEGVFDATSLGLILFHGFYTSKNGTFSAASQLRAVFYFWSIAAQVYC